MENIDKKLGEVTKELGEVTKESAVKIANSLKSIHIKLGGTSDNFIQTLSTYWNEFSDDVKIEISIAIGGKYNSSVFMRLMDEINNNK